MAQWANYYHVPPWMWMLIDGLTRVGLAHRLKNKGRTDEGMYVFAAGQGEEELREEMLIAWDKSTTPRAVIAFFKDSLLTDVKMLVGMLEDYARERNGREETKFCRYFIQLMIAITAELYAKERPGETLVINGDFSLIGQLPPDGRLRINGIVQRVEGSTGALLEIKCEDIPELHFRGMACQRETGVWQIERTVANRVFPPG